MSSVAAFSGSCIFGDHTPLSQSITTQENEEETIEALTIYTFIEL